MQPGADGTASARKSKLGWVIAPLLIFAALVGVVRLRAEDRRSLEAAVGADRQAGAGDAVRASRRPDRGRQAGAGLLQRRAGQRQCRASSTSGRRGASRAPRSSRCWSNCKSAPASPCTASTTRTMRCRRAASSAATAIRSRPSAPTAPGRGAIEWGVYGMPETFVLNGKGEIVFKHVGPISPESMRQTSHAGHRPRQGRAGRQPLHAAVPHAHGATTAGRTRCASD